MDQRISYFRREYVCAETTGENHVAGARASSVSYFMSITNGGYRVRLSFRDGRGQFASSKNQGDPRMGVVRHSMKIILVSYR
jgi:hypothetical protein